LEAVVRRALEKDPAKRFPDAESFAEALAPFASPEAARRFRSSLSMPISGPRSSKLPPEVGALTEIAPGETHQSFTASVARPRARWQSALLILTAVTVAVLVA